MKSFKILTILLLFSLFFTNNVLAAHYVPDNEAWIAGGLLDGNLTFDNNQIAYDANSDINTISFFSSDYELIGMGHLNSFDTGISDVFSLVMNDLQGLTRTLFGQIENKLSFSSIFLSFGFMNSTGDVDKTFLANVGDQSFGMFAGTFEDDVKIAATPIPAAVWLFGSGLMGLLTFSNRKTKRV